MVSDADVSAPSVHRFAFHGTGGSFFLIFLKNIFLTLLTLGVYLAWAKTERRSYVWNNFTLQDQHFRYTGTGLELFKGYLIVVSAYVLFLAIPALIKLVSPTAASVAQTLMGFGVFLVLPFLIYRSRAFLYNRTTWRGIRFGLLPKASKYAGTFLSGLALTFLTLGLYSPVMTNRLHRIVTENTRFGSLEFQYTGKDREAFWLGVKGFVLSVLTLGIYFFWYSAERKRYQFEHTRVGPGARLRSQLTGGDLFILFLLGSVATAITLGLAFPWVAMYSIRLGAERTFVEGEIDFEAIEQRTREAGATSDGFASAFDLDLGF